MRSWRRRHSHRAVGEHGSHRGAGRRRCEHVTLRAAHGTALTRRKNLHRSVAVKRAVIIILDGVGIGEAPDAADYGDAGSDTLGNVARSLGGLKLPRLERFGLGNIRPIERVSPRGDAAGAWGSMRPASPGKDSTTGHWEIAGVHLAKPFPTYPHGFPRDLLDRFARATGRPIIGNVVGSGTDVIDRFAEEQRRTGGWIVYTSADSVFQIAANEEAIPLTELYRACELAREMLVPPHDVSRQ